MESKIETLEKTNDSVSEVLTSILEKEGPISFTCLALTKIKATKKKGPIFPYRLFDYEQYLFFGLMECFFLVKEKDPKKAREEAESNIYSFLEKIIAHIETYKSTSQSNSDTYKQVYEDQLVVFETILNIVITKINLFFPSVIPLGAVVNNGVEEYQFSKFFKENIAIQFDSLNQLKTKIGSERAHKRSLDFFQKSIIDIIDKQLPF